MPLLKDDKDTLNSIKGTLSSIPSELRDVDSIKALQFSKWLLNKAKYYRIHKLNQRFKNIPKEIKRGDIVWVDFGINVGDEFSDEDRKGHFGLVWARQGWMIIIIPLSKQERKDDFTIPLGKIKGLPDNESFAKLDNIRAIHIRRVRSINWLEDKKVNISDETELMTSIKNGIKKVFLD